MDAFPNDPSEALDSDGDGVGDNSDAYPQDASRTVVPVSEISIESASINAAVFNVESEPSSLRIEVATSSDESIDWGKSKIFTSSPRVRHYLSTAVKRVSLSRN